jgi:hypothetical protein
MFSLEYIRGELPFTAAIIKDFPFVVIIVGGGISPSILRGFV